MKNRLFLIKLTLIWGIIADAFETLRMIFPGLFLSTTGLALESDIGLRIGLLYGMPVMLGWTIILFWVIIKPVERKGILICLIPVILSYVVVEIFWLKIGIVTLPKIIPVFVLQAFLMTFCLLSFFQAKKYKRNQAKSGIHRSQE
jgi:hypothetical protein